MADTSEDFLAKAKEAEDQAARAKNPVIKASWLKLAEGFRHLAEQAARGKPPWQVHIQAGG
jgi:hypothetical protein